MDSEILSREKLKKRYQSSFDDSKMLLLEFEVRNYFDWINRSNAIIKSQFIG